MSRKYKLHPAQDSLPMPYKYKYSGGAKLNNAFDVNLYETYFRSYDPQIGRFHQIDPLTQRTSNWSAYTFVQNNPLLYFDPLGLDTVINGENHQWDGGYLDEIIVNGKGGNNRNYSDYGIYWWGNSTPGYGQLGSLPPGPGAAAEQRVRDGLEELERVKVEENGGAGGRQAAQGGGGNPYQYIGSQERAYSMTEFINANKGLTRSQIISQMDNRSKTFLNSQQGGPSMRYVTNPHDGKVLDMRHMLVVGNLPPIIGNLVEVGQWMSGQASGMNPQDFYSNGVGYQFYMQYSGLQNFFYPNTFTNQLQNFFNSPRIIIYH